MYVRLIIINSHYTLCFFFFILITIPCIPKLSLFKEHISYLKDTTIYMVGELASLQRSVIIGLILHVKLSVFISGQNSTIIQNSTKVFARIFKKHINVIFSMFVYFRNTENDNILFWRNVHNNAYSKRFELTVFNYYL